MPVTSFKIKHNALESPIVFSAKCSIFFNSLKFCQRSQIVHFWTELTICTSTQNSRLSCESGTTATTPLDLSGKIM